MRREWWAPTLGQRDVDSSRLLEERESFFLKMFLLVGWLCPVHDLTNLTGWFINKEGHEVWKGWGDALWIKQELYGRVSWLLLCMNKIFNELILFPPKKAGMIAVLILVYKIMLEVSVSSPGKKDRREGKRDE